MASGQNIRNNPQSKNPQVASGCAVQRSGCVAIALVPQSSPKGGPSYTHKNTKREQQVESAASQKRKRPKRTKGQWLPPAQAQ